MQEDRPVPEQPGNEPGDEREGRGPLECALDLVTAVSTGVQRAGPETALHLWRAGRELTLAVRSLLEGVAEAFGSEGAEAKASAPVEHIPIRRSASSEPPPKTTP